MSSCVSSTLADDKAAVAVRERRLANVSISSSIVVVVEKEESLSLSSDMG